MGFWKSAFQVASDVTSLGGTYRLRAASTRHGQLVETYEFLRRTISEANSNLVASVERIRKSVRHYTGKLKSAYSILKPLGAERQTLNASDAHIQRGLVQTSRSLTTVGREGSIPAELATAAGAVSGAGAAAVSWGTVQVIAHASTGTAMAGLHGAAAANAGWAWFGGGSLATGGGGMAMGHLVLPGIGTAVAVAVSATLSHREANRLGKLCDELEGVNQENRAAVAKLDSGLSFTRGVETKLQAEGALFEDALHRARWKVRRFGWLSHWWRLLRKWLKGYYYTPEEIPFVEELDAAGRSVHLGLQETLGSTTPAPLRSTSKRCSPTGALHSQRGGRAMMSFRSTSRSNRAVVLLC